MTQLIISPELAEEIRREADVEGTNVDAVLEAAWRHYRTLAQRRKIDSEFNWWSQQPTAVQERYINEFVAVHNHEVVDHDSDRDTLFDRVRHRYGNIAILIVPAEGPEEIRVFRPRVERI